ncbi:protein C3orf33 homolog isoform X2 [Engraulis encrasicolus]|uniref:protein C3orf33 homolog isoform X2 n=1 Tax=Engraulis encrasicolus TaxID=184585 RepID=UPI002FD2BFC9
MPDEQSARLDKVDEKDKNLITVLSKFADDNLTIVRITKFNAASEIPTRFIERNVSLHGRVCRLTEEGLEVEHIPIHIPVLSRLLVKCQTGATPLQVRLAGVELTAEGRDWLRRQLEPAETPPTVWLKLIRREGDTLHCLVSKGRGLMLSTCLNDELLRQGLARSAPILGLDHRSRVYWRLHKRLMKAELQAERKGRGLWKEESSSLWERVSLTLRESFVGKIWKRLLSFTSRTKDQ